MRGILLLKNNACRKFLFELSWEDRFCFCFCFVNVVLEDIESYMFWSKYCFLFLFFNAYEYLAYMYVNVPLCAMPT